MCPRESDAVTLKLAVPPDDTGSLNMTAEVASTVAAAAGALGAFLAGYLTPERSQPASPAEVLTP